MSGGGAQGAMSPPRPLGNGKPWPACLMSCRGLHECRQPPLPLYIGVGGTGGGGVVCQGSP